MQIPDSAPFICEPDPDHPGWYGWALKERGLFNDLFAPMRGRPDGPGRGRVWCAPDRRLGNTRGNVHGGAILGFVDLSLFCGATMAGAIGAVHAVTLDCNVQFLEGPRVDRPIEAVVDVLRESKRLIFLRGLVTQGDVDAASFSAVIRKTGAPIA